MELINIGVSQWSINIESYFGDVYLMHRTWLLVAGVVIVLRIAKRIRKAVR